MAFDTPSSFGKFAQHSQMSFAPNVPNITTGNPMIDMAVSMLLSGSGVAPRPIAGQSVMESYLQRQRSNEYLKAMRHSFGSQAVFQKLGGVNTDSGWGNLMSMVLGNPDGMMNNPILRAFNGGNPVRAHMGLMQQATGMTASSITGQLGDFNFGQTKQMMTGLNYALFQNRRIDDNDIRTVRNQKERDIMNFVTADANRQDRFKSFLKEDDAGNISFDHRKFDEIRKKTKDFTTKTAKALPEIMIEEAKKVMEMVDPIREIREKKGQLMPIKLNGEITRGYELQDLSKSMMQMQDLGLVDMRRHYQDAVARGSRNPLGVATDMGVKHVGRILRATSDLTGAESADEATAQFNELMGNTRLDISDDTQADYAEGLLRKVKGVARTAGVSIDALMGIIKTTKALASQHAGLQYMGGAGAIETSLRVFQSAQATAQVYGNSVIREKGGMNQYVLDEQNRAIQNMTQPIVQQLYAARAMVQLDGSLSPEQRQNALALIKARANDPNADFSANGVAAFQRELSRVTGLTEVKIQRGMDDKGLAQRGVQLSEEAKIKGEDDIGEQNAAVAGSLGHFWLMAQEKFGHDIQAGKGKIIETIDQNGLKVQKQLKTTDEYKQYMKEQIWSGKKPDDVLTELGLYGGNFDKFLDPTSEQGALNRANLFVAIRNENPAYIAARKQINDTNEKFKREDAAVARRLHHLNQPIGQVLAQELLAGNLKHGFRHFQSAISTPGAMRRSEDILRSIEMMQQEHTDKAAREAFWQTRGGAQNLPIEQVIKNLQDQGATQSEITETLRQRQAWSKEREDSFDKVAGTGITMNQVLSLYRDGKSAFKDSEWAKQGMEWEDVRNTSDYLWHTGLANSRNRKNFGAIALTRKTREDMIRADGMARSIDMLNRDALTESHTTFGNKLNDILSALETSDDPDKVAKAAEIRAAMIEGGYMKLSEREVDKWDAEAVTDALEDGTASSHVRDLMLKYGAKYLELDKNGRIDDGDGSQLQKDLEAGIVDPRIVEALKEEGYATFKGDKAKIIGWDAAAVGEGYKENVSAALMAELKAVGAVDDQGNFNRATFEKMMRSGGKDAAEMARLATEEGFATAESDGTISTVESTKLDKALRRDKANEKLKQISELDTLLAEQTKNREILNTAVNDAKKANGDEEDEGDKLTKELKDQIAKSGQSLESAIDKIARALTSLTQIQ